MIKKLIGSSKEEVQNILKLHHQLSINHDIIVLEKDKKILWNSCSLGDVCHVPHD
jgi:hypothetical protein